MKKIIALFVVMLAFGLNANAQKKATTVAAAPAQKSEMVAKRAAFSEAAIKDVNTLAGYIKLTADQKVNLKSVFENKHSMLSQNLSAERKAVIAQNVEARLKSTLEPEQLSKIEGNAELMKTLTN